MRPVRLTGFAAVALTAAVAVPIFAQSPTPNQSNPASPSSPAAGVEQNAPRTPVIPRRIPGPGPSPGSVAPQAAPQAVPPTQSAAPSPAPADSETTPSPSGGAPSPEAGAPSGGQRRFSPPAPAPAGGMVSLNFNRADLVEIIHIIAQQLHLTYTIDPEVKGTVTINSAEPLRSEDLLPIFHQILRMNGAVAVRTGNLYHIMPIKDGKGLARPAGQNKEDGFALQVIPVRFFAVAEMKRVLTPFLQPGGEIIENPRGNFLIVMDLPSNIQRLMEIADMILIALPRINQLLVIGHSEAAWTYVKRWLDRIDVVAEGPGRRIFIYPVENGKADDLAAILTQALGLPSSGGNRPSTSLQDLHRSYTGGTSQSGSSQMGTSGRPSTSSPFGSSGFSSQSTYP